MSGGRQMTASRPRDAQAVSRPDFGAVAGLGRPLLRRHLRQWHLRALVTQRQADLRPAGLALIRRSAQTPISSCESLYGRRQFRPYFENQSVDYAIIDVAWNGILESLKIAAMADAYEVNVAPHNFNGHLGSLISAHMCAVAPNFKVMEIDIDDVKWKDDIVTVPPVIENGDLLLPTGPGWGADVNEEFVRAHPPKR